MIVNINRWVYENRNGLLPTRRLLCRSGLSMSVQANRYCYCSPRRDMFPYYEFEVGYPTFDVHELQTYRQEDSEVYPYVPVEVIEWVVRKHGGIVNFHQFLLPS